MILLTTLTEQLKQCYPPHSASRVAEELLSFVLEVPRSELLLLHEDISSQSQQQIDTYVARLVQGEPLEYILGSVLFYECQIRINRNVLIPRQETELLVHHIAQHIGNKTATLWDLGTGSGCIGLALKRACPNLTVTLTDICHKALALAQDNASHNHLMDIRCLQGDLLAPLEGEQADFIVMNPPYIGEEEELDPGVRLFEPSQALFAGNRGLQVFQRLAQELPAYMHASTELFFEIGHTQGPAVQELFRSSLNREVVLLKDWAGHDRFIWVRHTHLTIL